MKNLFTKLIISAAFVFASAAQAGTIVVSGDANISDNLSSKPGNAAFFSNVLGSGTSVFVLSTTPSLCCADPLDDTINAYYDALPGVTSTKINSPVTAANLAGVNLFVALMPNLAFTGAETLALANFLTGGGSVFLLGDNSSFPGENTNVNNLLIALGSGMRIVGATIDGGAFFSATALPHPLTAGVASLQYAATSTVTGGTALFRTVTGSQTFIAVESSAVSGIPEPSAWILSACGLAALVLRRRKR